MSISFSAKETSLLIRALESNHSSDDFRDVLLVTRAWGRFNKELQWYSDFPKDQKPYGSLRVVRQYHRLLIDEIRSYEQSLKLKDDRSEC